MAICVKLCLPHGRHEFAWVENVPEPGDGHIIDGVKYLVRSVALGEKAFATVVLAKAKDLAQPS